MALNHPTEGALKQLSLASWNSCLKNAKFIGEGVDSGTYRVFSFEPFHKFNLGASELLKQFPDISKF